MAFLALTIVIMGADALTAPQAHAAGQSAVNLPPSLLEADIADQTSLFYATDPEATALISFQNQAVQNTLSDHGLPASDANAVLSWGREDAEAELWGLIEHAITATTRTADQQAVVDWLSQVAYREGLLGGYYAGLEYVKWAGLSQSQYQSDVMAYNTDYQAGKDTTTDKTNLQNFLAQQPLTYNSTDPSKATGGYCVYQSPAPFQSDYTANIYGSNVPVECTKAGGFACLAGCVPPIPDASQFEKWGEADVNNTIVNNPSVTQSARDIALALGVGSLIGGASVAAGGVAIAVALSGVMAGSAFEAAVFPFASIPLYAVGNGIVAGSYLTPLAGAVAASGVAAIIGAVLLFIIGTTLQVMNLVNVSNVQSDLTNYIEGATGNSYDPASMLNTTNGAGELYSIFVAATLPPAPPASDTTAIPFPVTSCVGSHTDASGYTVGCLDPPPPPAPDPQTDPVFIVTPDGGTAGPDQSTLTWYDKASNITNSAYLSDGGGWFVDTMTLSDGTHPLVMDTDLVSRPLQQLLSIQYTDWSGNEQVAALFNVPGNGYHFLSINQQQGGTALNPATCTTDNTCTVSNGIQYVDSSGNKFSATVIAPPLPKIWGTDIFGSTEGSPPMVLEANADSPINSPLTYAWQIEDKPLVPSTQICTTGGTNPTPIPCPPPTVTVYGNPATYTFPTSGNFNVTLTVTDAAGLFAKDSFSVAVTDVAPSLSFGPPCNPFLIQFVCGVYAEPTGTPTTLAGVIGHAGAEDVEALNINWGDGTPASQFTNAACISYSQLIGVSNCPGNPINFLFSSVYSVGSTVYLPFNATHTYAKPGAYTVTATVTDQSGAVSTQTTTEEVGPTTTTLTTSPNPSVWGQPVTLTASVSSPTGGIPSGTVSFSAGSATISGCSAQPVNTSTETATCDVSTLAVSASDSLTATYSGDSSFASSVSAPASQAVRQAATTTQVASNANPSVWGQPVTLTATISATAPGAGAPSGTVVFKDGSNTISGCGATQVDPTTGTATCVTSALSVASHAITADYSGDGDFLGSASSSLTQVVNKASVAATVTSANNPATHGQSVTFTAKVVAAAPGAGTPTGTVTFMNGSTVLGTASLGTVGGVATATFTTSSLAAGARSITVVYNGDGNFLGGASPTLTQYINNDLSVYPTLADGAYDLSNINLGNGAFVGENLSGATLYNGRFVSAYFISANLSGADMSDVNLAGATFTDANLTNANLSKANLTGAIGLSSATLTGVNWNGATCPDGTTASNHGGTCAGHL